MIFDALVYEVGAARWLYRTLGEVEAGAGLRSSLGDKSADVQVEPGGLSRVSRGAEFVECRPYGGDTVGLREECRCQMGGEEKYGGCRVSAGRGSQRGYCPGRGVNA